MTTAQLEERLVALEKTIAQLVSRLDHPADPTRPWWREDAGRFAGDPVFEEIVRLGREYRESLRPDPEQGRARLGDAPS